MCQSLLRKINPFVSNHYKTVNTTWLCFSEVDYARQSSEKANVQFRHSLYYVKDLKAGDVITADAICSARSGYWFAPKFGPQVVGRQLKHYVTRHTPVQWPLW